MEEWFEIEKYPQFSITKDGRVRNNKTGTILKPRLHDGHMIVSLNIKGKKVRQGVKNLLAETFIPNPYEYSNVLLKDGNPENLSIGNIYWTNQSGGGTIVEKLKQGTILNNFTVIEDLYEPNTPRKLIVKCNKCEKTVRRSFTEVNRKECACDKPRTKSKQERNKKYLNKNKKRLLHTIGGEESIMLCRKCRKFETVKNSNISNKVNEYCCEDKKTEKTYEYKFKNSLRKKFYSMKNRCYNPNNPDYVNYGGRGITICDEWLEDYNNFIEWGMKSGYNLYEPLSIDRINNDGNYTPENCQWIPQSINCRKTRRSKLSYQDAEKIRELFDNRTYSRKELQVMFNISKGHLSTVLRRGVWDIDKKDLKWVM